MDQFRGVGSRAAIGAIAVLVCGGCASMFIHGGRLVNRRQSIDEASAVYQIADCRDASGAPGQRPDATYYVIPQPSGPELLERAPDGSGVLISNRWEDAAGTHYFAWGAGLGWEFTLPADGSPATRLGHRHPSSREEADGTRRPEVSRAPESTCSLVLVQGAPPVPRAAIAAARAPAPMASPMPTTSGGSVASAPAPSPATPAVTHTATTTSTAGVASSACAAGRIETPEGFCCLPGQRWDAASHQCAGAPTPVATCAEGRAPTSDGYCCWPGQVFDRSVRACSGPPRCPAGLGASGEDCVRAR